MTKELKRIRIVAVGYDGGSREGTGPIGGLADRHAFQERFGVSTVVLIRYLDDAGALREDADLTAFNEDWAYFLPWCVLQRAGAVTESFEEFLAATAELEVSKPEDGVDAVPMGGAPSPGP